MRKGNCQDCGAADPRVSLGGIGLCDRCADRRIAQITGFPELPDPPPPFVITGFDGVPHQLVPRLWRAPTGIELELEEAGVHIGEGYHFAVLGSHDADVADLFAHARGRAEEEIGRQYLEEAPHRPGWRLRDDEVAGRLVWGDERELGGPYDVVVDGRTLTWDDLGRALEAYEGWSFRLVIEDRHLEDLRPDADIIAFAAAAEHPGEDDIVPGGNEIPTPTIDDVLADFLAEQEKRLAPRTLRSYAEVIELLGHCLNNYGHQSLNDAERRRWEQRYDQDEAAFTRLFGPDKIAENLGEFLDYFMIRKVMAGEELMRAAGTVTKKLAKWLGEHGYLDADAVEIAVERGGDAARDLPKAERLSGLLFDHARSTTIDANALKDDDHVEDYLMIEKVEPGKLWFEGGIGPVTVPRTARPSPNRAGRSTSSSAAAARRGTSSRSATSTRDGPQTATDGRRPPRGDAHRAARTRRRRRHQRRRRRSRAAPPQDQHVSRRGPPRPRRRRPRPVPRQPDDPIDYEGIRETYLPECHFSGKTEQHRSRYALRSVAMIRAGLQPDLLAEVSWWRTNDLWIWSWFALVIFVRIAAERTGDPVATISRQIARRHGIDLGAQA